MVEKESSLGKVLKRLRDNETTIQKISESAYEAKKAIAEINEALIEFFESI